MEHTTGLLHKTKLYIKVEDYDLPKSTSHILSVPLTLTECISFHLPDDFICKIAIRADDTAFNWSCDKPFDLSQQVEIKIWKCNTRNFRKCSSASSYILIFGKLFYIYKLIHIDLKPRILIASFL